MAIFNKKLSTTDRLKRDPTATTNHEGALAFTMGSKMELYTRVATCLYGQDKFYVTGQQANAELSNLLNTVIENDPEFVLKLANYTRNKLNLRSIPQVLLAETLNKKSIEGGYKYVPKIVKRADEITEILAYQLNRNAALGIRIDGKKIPKSIQKGLGVAMQNFNEYQYSKYDKDGMVTFKDAISLVRPKPRDDLQNETFKCLVGGSKLPLAETWENHITIHGSTKEAWEQILPKMPVFAVLRNLRTLLDKNVNNIEVATEKLENPEVIAKSRILPFRFYQALRMVNRTGSSNTSKVVDALQTAMNHACNNVPKLDGKTCVMVDLSGSMTNPCSTFMTTKRMQASSVSMRDIASIFGGTAVKTGDVIVAGYGQNMKWIPVSKHSAVLDNAAKIITTDVGHSTYAHLPIEDLIKRKEKVDRFINFSDMQCYGGVGYGAGHLPEAFLNYRNRVNQHAKMYSVDLSGYGTSVLPDKMKGVYTIAGWSNSIFDFIAATDSGENVIDLINNFE